MDILTHVLDTPYGELLLGAHGDALCLCDWRFRRMRASVDARIQRGLGAVYREGTSLVIEQVKEELDAYFRRERTVFDVPLRLVGTDFQRKVWEALMTVPYGATETYASLTAKVAEPAAIRAVAAANGANGLSILVPCHRIIGSTGELVGYAGGLQAKRKLLELEGACIAPTQADLFSADTL